MSFLAFSLLFLFVGVPCFLGYMVFVAAVVAYFKMYKKRRKNKK